ncbi:MAG: ASKHA domain-containing protein, partial [Desulfobacteraceae bacterium]
MNVSILGHQQRVPETVSSILLIMNELNKKEIKDSWIKLINISMSPPGLGDNTADVDRLVKHIKKTISTNEVSIPFSLVKKIPSFLREHKYRCNIALHFIKKGWRIIDVYPPGDEMRIYAVAVDLGSSTVVIRMIDIISGENLKEVSFTNPQHEIGSDILSRIHFASENNGIAHLQEILINEINREIKAFREMLNIGTSEIVGLAAAGNTAMTHFFLGLDPYWICREPYIPVINSPDIISPSDIGIDINPGAPVVVMPGAGSYLGGDVIAGVLASGMNKKSGVSLLVDVGTNAEVVLGNNEWLMACAGAAGPALEGGVAAMGMMAGPGAIDKVVIDRSSRDIRFGTIGGGPPAGICGSGLIDLAAHLFLSGMIDLMGKFDENVCSGRLINIDGVKNLIVATATETESGNELYISQTDINALIRSKAAMYTILNTITGMANIDINEIDRFYIAGTFGAYIDPVSAISLGMIPDLPLDKYVSIGN